MKILLSTLNQGKRKEYLEFLKELNIEILTLRDFGIEKGFKEKGRSFDENAFIKAKYGNLISGMPTIGEDSGLVVYYLDNLPGIYSKRFSDSGKDEENRKLLLKILEGVPFEKRKAKFICVIYFFLDKSNFFKFRGEVEGFITYEERGASGFGYDPLFLYPPLGRTFAELSLEKKNEISHRGKALKELKEFLLKIL
ncbi:MAG: RdgB/HAM1 family non-canonical purine NTP pyrophosphatase [candidate division WOR-3 bacterium]